MRAKIRFSIVVCALGSIAGTAHANLILDGGFESAGLLLGAGNSFREFPLADAGWSANQTDGEVMTGSAHSGDYYADLLQNSGGNPDTLWDETSFTFGHYDRIVTFANVQPNSNYELSFWHAGGSRFGYTAADTLVQIQSMNSGMAITDRSTTPGLFDWQLKTIRFTTDASTTRLAMSFSSIGPNNSSVLLDDVSLVPEPTTLAALGIGLGALARKRRR